ncbi:MAG: pyridoxal-phosphate dependent enzyme [Acidimicrobiales bacterium]
MSLFRDPPASSIVCYGCGTVLDPKEPYPFRCPNAGDGADHVLRRVLDTSRLEFPRGESRETNPFVRYRSLLHAYHLAQAAGMSDADFVTSVRELDAAVVAVDGHGFAETPFVSQPRLAEGIGLDGSLLVKDETVDVSGSHKARHLFGLLLHLDIVEKLGLTDPSRRRPLAIASCGNAALAAGVVASAGRRRLVVFVPADIDASIAERLSSLGAEVTICEREPGISGDPTYHHLQAAISEGAVPFTCQGNENGLSIEGGETIGYEIIDWLALSGSALDDIVIQVGGGALASSVAAALGEGVAFGVFEQLPRFHTVQTTAAWPLKRAFDRVSPLVGGDSSPRAIDEVLHKAGRDRSSFMWPWESTPHSVAHGILDDETYDWLAVLQAMLVTGGRPVVVEEDQLEGANRLARELSGIDVDATGSAGLAGLTELRRESALGRGETSALLFTGRRRPPGRG